MPSPTHRQPAHSGFTLTELLMAMAVVVILLTIVISVTGKVRGRVADVKCVANLHGIGRAMAMYVEDNAGRLPGPLRGGQGDTISDRPGVARFFSGTQRSDNTLGFFLGPYLGMPQVEAYLYTELFMCPAFSAQGYSGPSYLLATRIDRERGAATDHDPGFSKDIEFPFGYPGRNPGQNQPSDLYQPKTMFQITEMGISASRLWALSDTDRKVPGGVENAGWKGGVPLAPIHGGLRNALFFDWHVGQVAPSAADARP